MNNDLGAKGCIGLFFAYLISLGISISILCGVVWLIVHIVVAAL